MSKDNGNYNWNDNYTWYVMSHDNGNYNWNDNYN